MGLFSWIKKLFRKHSGHVLTDEDREIAIELRQKKRELRLAELELESQLKQQKIELQIAQTNAKLAEFDDDEEEEEEDDLTLALSAIQKFFPQAIPNMPQQQPISHAQIVTYGNEEPELRSIPDTQLLNIWDSVPQSAKLRAHTLNDMQLKQFINAQLPGCDEDTYNRAIRIVRGR